MENTKNDYGFDAETVKNAIVAHMREFLAKIGCRTVVLGISGGKDSCICAALAALAVGPDNVYGVMMPNGEQKDIQDSVDTIKLLGIKPIRINIEDAFCSIRDAIENNSIDVSEDTKINLPPRLRMSTLYAVAQSVGGCVLCTDNKLERLSGYFTIFGDGAGSYAPLKDLTVSEVLDIGRQLGLPARFVDKKPGDGLQLLGDEDRLGLTYSDFGNFVRYGKATDELREKIMTRYRKNKFKTDIVDIPGPVFGFPDFVSEGHV